MTKQDYEKYRITGRNADGDLMKSIVRSRKDAEATARYWRVQFNFTKVKIRGLTAKPKTSQDDTIFPSKEKCAFLSSDKNCRIKQEVLKEMKERHPEFYPFMHHIITEREAEDFLSEAIDLAISKTREGIFEDINQATRKKPPQDILDVMEKWRKNVGQG